MLFCEEQENSSHFLVLSTKACLASLQHHLPTAGLLQIPQGTGLLPLPMATPGSEAAPARVAWLSLPSCRWGNVEGRGLVRSFKPPDTGDEGNTCGEWPGQAGAGVPLLTPVLEVEHQGYRGCRPRELHGGPDEEEEGEERRIEVFYCVPG